MTMEHINWKWQWQCVLRDISEFILYNKYSGWLWVLYMHVLILFGSFDSNTNATTDNKWRSLIKRNNIKKSQQRENSEFLLFLWETKDSFEKRSQREFVSVARCTEYVFLLYSVIIKLIETARDSFCIWHGSCFDFGGREIFWEIILKALNRKSVVK